MKPNPHSPNGAEESKASVTKPLVRVGKVFLYGIGFLTAVWSILALVIDLKPQIFGTIAAVIYGLLLIPLFYLAGRFPRRILALYGPFALVLIWWELQSPSHDRNWLPEVSRMPRAEIDGDFVKLYDVRDFDYVTETEYTPRYVSREVRLSELEGVDLAVCYWGSGRFAHPILSFRFKDQAPISFSIETRKEVGESYSAFLGFFHQYELIYIVAEERDVLRLRTHLRQGEWAYLYKTFPGKERAKLLFLDYLRRVNELYAKPKFYNALTSNCTTNVRIHVTASTNGKAAPWDIRILLNGKMDELAYERGLLDDSITFEELKSASKIDPDVWKRGDPMSYSDAIRSGLPTPSFGKK